VDAFWSLTMYDGSDFYVVANRMNRYSIGDRTPGLKHNNDGFITLYVGNASPRRGPRVKLAASARRAVPAVHAHVPTAPEDPRRNLCPSVNRPHQRIDAPARRRHRTQAAPHVASILYVRGEDPAYVMSQLGYTDTRIAPPVRHVPYRRSS
jgi:hypothetical protein